MIHPVYSIARATGQDGDDITNTLYNDYPTPINFSIHGTEILTLREETKGTFTLFDIRKQADLATIVWESGAVASYIPKHIYTTSDKNYTYMLVSDPADNYRDVKKITWGTGSTNIITGYYNNFPDDFSFHGRYDSDNGLIYFSYFWLEESSETLHIYLYTIDVDTDSVTTLIDNKTFSAEYEGLSDWGSSFNNYVVVYDTYVALVSSFRTYTTGFSGEGKSSGYFVKVFNRSDQTVLETLETSTGSNGSNYYKAHYVGSGYVATRDRGSDPVYRHISDLTTTYAVDSGDFDSGDTVNFRNIDDAEVGEGLALNFDNGEVKQIKGNGTSAPIIRDYFTVGWAPVYSDYVFSDIDSEVRPLVYQIGRRAFIWTNEMGGTL